MTDREVMQQALEALDGLFGLPNQWESGGVSVWRLGGSDAPRQAITALRTALAMHQVSEFAQQQQQAEPVAWMDKHGNIDHGLDAILEPEGWKPLYTIPPAAQRQWVVLTDEQLDDIAVFARRGNLHDLRIAIEAKLKEKNSD